MKLPYFYLNLYEIGVSEYHLKIIWKNHRKSIKCSHTRSEWFHIFSTDEGIASISYNPAVYVYEIFIYSSYTFIYFATVIFKKIQIFPAKSLHFLQKSYFCGGLDVCYCKKLTFIWFEFQSPFKASGLHL